jgi:O-antigen ligase
MQLWLGIVAGLIWIPRWRDCLVGASKYFAFFLMITGGLVVLGKVWEPFIHNDRFAFYIWRDFALMGVSTVLPLVVLCPYGDRLRNMCAWLGVCAFLLASYALTHNGVGPGSWVFDENDVCFVLVMLLPFPLLLWRHMRNVLVRILLLSSAWITFGGIVSTNSRGGFVGLLCGFALLFYRSRHKGRLVLFAFFLGILGLFLVPSEYWLEMSSISDVSSGTAQKRRDYWFAAIQLWLYPPHILAGVGIGNSANRLGEMVGEATFYGRAVHSMYFQLLPELGLVGIVFFVLMIGGALRGNFRGEKLNQRILALLSMVDEDSVDESRRHSLALIGKECLFVERAFLAANVSWFGLLGAGAFISVLYYPPMWILIGVSVAIQVYAENLARLFQDLMDEDGEEPKNSNVVERSWE